MKLSPEQRRYDAMSPAGEKISGMTWLMIGVLILFFPALAALTVVFSQSQKAPKDFKTQFQLEGVRFAPAVSADKAKAKYQDSSWDPTVLQFYDEGPEFLPRETEFEVAPFPANDSPETATDLETLRRYAAQARTPETLEMINFEKDMGTPLVSYEKAGLYSSAQNPDTDRLVTAAVVEAGYFLVKAKKHFLRVRPDFLAPDLKTVIPNPGHPSYPSGHAGQAQITGLILSDLDSKHRDIYMQHARAIGTRREIAGVHYPTDSIAGRKLAGEVYAKLLEVPKFQELFQEAKENFVPADESAFAGYTPEDVNAVSVPAVPDNAEETGAEQEQTP
ncbi:MAG: phosphatase PAP2 family protein [Alphaproteobacteria bacterium]|nr:phosphatase PAP2 family protein [Alphaproteobacteria bacterium]